MKDFWLACGHHLLDRDERGRLCLTDEFMKAYLARPEVVPPPEACGVERTLHTALLSDPWRPVAAAQIAAIEDTDARENWHLLIEFRNHLARHSTLEAMYAALVRARAAVPPIFLNQLVHLILRNALDQCDNPYMLRAAELFFRPQRVTVYAGSLLVADVEQVEANPPTLSPLTSMFGLPANPEIDVLSDDNASSYWQRSDRFDLALDLTTGRLGLAALGAVISCWVKHLLDVDVVVEPLNELRDVALAWYVGLDADGTKIGDALWNGAELDEATRATIVGLFRLTFCDPRIVLERLSGEPVYLILAMTPGKMLRMKPQNLLTSLPIRGVETVT
jgi:Family of unknown function (DUF6352)